MDNASLSSDSQVSNTSKSGNLHQPRPPGEPKPAYQRFGRSVNNAGKIVRAAHLGAGRPHSSKKPKLSSSRGLPHNARGGGREEKKRSAGWSPVRPVHVPHPSMSTFLQSLMKTPTFTSALAPAGSKRSHPKLRSVVSRIQHQRRYSASNLTSSSAGSKAMTSGDLDALQLRDELVELKKQMNIIVKEREVAKAQQIKLSRELQRKDLQIEDLLKSGHISTHDATRSLVKVANKAQSTALSSAPGGSDGGAVVTSLKQKVHSLEQVLRKKESDVTELKRSVGATQVNELKIQVEVYCREIDRLNQLLHEQSEEHNSVGGLPKCSPRSGREAHIKLNALNKATVKMAAELESLEEQNKTLKHKLEKSHSLYNPSALSPDPKEVGMRGSLADGYEDYNRAQMLSAIVNLELQCAELQKTVRILEEEKVQMEIQNEQKVADLKKEVSASHNKLALAKHDLTALQDTESKLKSVIRRLKEDRVHYRKTSEITRSELSGIQTTLQEKELSRVETSVELQALQELHNNEKIAMEHARKLARKASRALGSSSEKKKVAATTIQRNWRKYKSMRKQQKFQLDTEDAIIDIQSAFRGHLARRQLLASSQDNVQNIAENSESDDIGSESSEASKAIEFIQSAMKGFLTRRSTLTDMKKSDTDLQLSDVAQSSINSLSSRCSSSLGAIRTPPFYAAAMKKSDKRISKVSTLMKVESEDVMSELVPRAQYVSSDSEPYYDPEDQLLKEEI